MRNKLFFLAGMGAGYVLGSRAGRQRYEQIAQASRRVAEHPKVQETAGLIQAKTGALVNTAKDVLNSKLEGTKLGDKFSGAFGDHGAHAAPEEFPHIEPAGTPAIR
jgi:hypothetical protein